MCRVLWSLLLFLFLLCRWVTSVYRWRVCPKGRYTAHTTRTNTDLQLGLKALPWVIRTCRVSQAGPSRPDVNGRLWLWWGWTKCQVDWSVGTCLLVGCIKIMWRWRDLECRPQTSTGACTVVDIHCIVVWSFLTTVICHHTHSPVPLIACHITIISDIRQKLKIIGLSTGNTNFTTKNSTNQCLVTQCRRMVCRLCWHLQCNGVAMQEVTLVLTSQDRLTGIPVMGILQVYQMAYTSLI
jgi:hypothetical protein